MKDNKNEFDKDLSDYVSQEPDDNDLEDSVSEEDIAKLGKLDKANKILVRVAVIVCSIALIVVLISFLPKIIWMIDYTKDFVEDQQAGKDQEQTNSPIQSTDSKPEFTYVYITNRVGDNAVGQKSLQGIVMIQNTGNTNLYLGSSQFDVEDENGNIVAVENYINGYPQIIEPGEYGVYYESISSENLDMSKTYTLVPHLNIYKCNSTPIRFDVSDITFTHEYSRIKALGKITNNTSQTYDTCIVAVIMYDAEKRIIGICTTVEEYKAGETKGFEASYYSYFDETAEDVAWYDVYAYPHQYQFD